MKYLKKYNESIKKDIQETIDEILNSLHQKRKLSKSEREFMKESEQHISVNSITESGEFLFKRINKFKSYNWMDEKKLIKLTDIDISIIQNIISKIPIEISSDKLEECGWIITAPYKNKQSHNNLDYAIGVSIFKYEDEYFICSLYDLVWNTYNDCYDRVDMSDDDDLYYLCDQEEGLKSFGENLNKLLTDIINGVNNGCWLL